MRRISCVCLTVAALLGASTPVFCDDAGAVQAYGKGIDKLQDNDWSGAAAAFRQAVKMKPDYAAAYDKLGLALYDENHQMRAVTDFKLATAIDPRLTIAWYDLGMGFENMDKDVRLKTDARTRERMRQSDEPAAIAAYGNALEVSPSNDVWAEAHSHFRLGVLLRDKAIAAWVALHPDQSLVAPPAPVRGQSQAQTPSVEQANLKAAMGHLEQALTLMPDFPEDRNELGRLYDFIGRYHAAIDQYSRAIAEKPGYAEAYANRGVAWWKAGNWDRALADTRIATQVSPLFAGGHYDFAEVLYAHVQVLRISPTGTDESLIHLEARKAIDEFNLATAQDPAFMPAWYGLARAYAGYFDFPDAEKTYHKILSLDRRQRQAKVEL
ncbi:MAG: tetratricopeptide repeat protein, partial [bacterium]